MVGTGRLAVQSVEAQPDIFLRVTSAEELVPALHS